MSFTPLISPSRPKSVPPQKLSAVLRELVEAFHERPVRLKDVIARLHSRAYDMLLLFLGLPFISPIPIPVLSTAFGLVVAWIGLRLAMGQNPFLPERLLRIELPPRFFPTLLKGAEKVLRFFELVLRPRLTVFSDSRYLQMLNGLIIMLCGILLSLPLPIPLTNGFPGWTILLLAAGALERDGASILVGYGMFTVTLAFFTFLYFGGTQVIRHLIDLL